MHTAPISDLDSNSETVASSDTDGNISIWNFNQDELVHLSRIDSYG